MSDFYTALNNGDFKTVEGYLLPEGFTEFSSRGGVIIDIPVNLLKNLIENGLAVNVALQHIETYVSGNMAYAVYYRTGTIERPDKDNNVPPHTARVTSVWIKQDGNWYLKHVHNSKSGH